LSLQEIESSSPKVKRAALSVLGTLHIHLGPGFRALSLALTKKPAVKEEMEQCFDTNEFDPSLHSTEWPKRPLGNSASSKDGPQTSDGGGLIFDVPKTDLFSLLSDDCFKKMVRKVHSWNDSDNIILSLSFVYCRQGSKDGKAAWKMRKAALDEIDHALKQCSGLLDTSPSNLKNLIDLTRGLRERLADTQINLKPSAARIVGSLLAVVDRSAQEKLCKLVYGPLINASMNDIKKPMKEASLHAIRAGFTLSSLDGGGLNEDALVALATALVGQVNESAVRVRACSYRLLFGIQNRLLTFCFVSICFLRPGAFPMFCSFCLALPSTFRI
jgi:hypothetical protein